MRPVNDDDGLTEAAQRARELAETSIDDLMPWCQMSIPPCGNPRHCAE
jgi:hypothetical protein